MTQSKKIRFTLRLPKELFNKIDEKAKKKGMSRNSYILWILDEYHNLDIDRKYANVKQEV